VRLAEGGFGKRELDHDLGVGTACRAGGPAPGTERIASEERIEDVAEPERLTGAARTCASATTLAEEVVAAPAFGVAQRVVRDADFLEALLGSGSSRLLSGWNRRASSRYARLISSSVALRSMPRTS
jgi:hypothetical protein